MTDNFNKEPSPWKFGFFYYNKKDRRLFPPKRFGLGWTINFANPLSVIVFLLILIFIFLIGHYLNR
ncbi:DUF5808 domain-containing protein [Chryseobacterium ginsengisoli]|uniref:DUF5808 domain-containing protein n=1 Tax=Chryseobacterium ginsengisoli TaxID=363853 RepID=UPI0031F03230